MSRRFPHSVSANPYCIIALCGKICYDDNSIRPYAFYEVNYMRKLFSSVLSAVTAAAVMLGRFVYLPAGAESAEPKLIALTFDDGPNTTTTNDVLDILEEKQQEFNLYADESAAAEAADRLADADWIQGVIEAERLKYLPAVVEG